MLRVRDPGGRLGRQAGSFPVQGADGRGGRRAQDQLHHAGPAGAAYVRAAALLRHASGEKAAKDED